MNLLFPHLLVRLLWFYELEIIQLFWIADLSYSTSESSIKEEFSNFGQVAEVKLVKDETSKKSKGYAFVQYTNQDDAISALENMDEKYLDGRVIFVELAKPIKDKKSFYPRTSGPPQDLQFLAQKEAGDSWKWQFMIVLLRVRQ